MDKNIDYKNTKPLKIQMLDPTVLFGSMIELS